MILNTFHRVHGSRMTALFDFVNGSGMTIWVSFGYCFCLRNWFKPEWSGDEIDGGEDEIGKSGECPEATGWEKEGDDGETGEEN